MSEFKITVPAGYEVADVKLQLKPSKVAKIPLQVTRKQAEPVQKQEQDLLTPDSLVPPPLGCLCAICGTVIDEPDLCAPCFFRNANRFNKELNNRCFLDKY